VNRLPVLHLLLDFNGDEAPALAAIWEFILDDMDVLQTIREAAAHGNDVVIRAVSGPSGLLSIGPSFSLCQAAPSEFDSHSNYVVVPSVPNGAGEIRVHLTGRHAAALAILLHRYWPDHQNLGQRKKIS